MSLLPITETLANVLPQDQLSDLLDTLWDCLGKESDDLGSSVGAIMDLLRAMVQYPSVRESISNNKDG